MKNINLLLTLPLVALSQLLHADATEPTTGFLKKEKSPYIQYHNRMAVFGPLHQAYERIKNDDVYIGVEGWLVPTYRGGKHKAISEFEVRGGYNFFYYGRDHVSPFIGLGVFKDFSEKHTHEYVIVNNSLVDSGHKKRSNPAVVYTTVGFLYNHEFNSIFNLGFNLKALLGGSVHNKKKESLGNTVGGFDASLPITFRFGHKRHWDYRLEPFDLFLAGNKHSENFFGFRSTLGYRF